MAILVQSDDGNVEDAVSYITLEWFQAYHTARGNSLGTKTSTEQEQALVRAKDYIDSRFKYVGYRLNGTRQVTEWPREEAYNRDEDPVYGIPREVKEAQAEYALRALTSSPAPLAEDVAAPGRIQSITSTVGPITETITYASGGGTFVMPDYPLADNKLKQAGLVRNRSSGNITRG